MARCTASGGGAWRLALSNYIACSLLMAFLFQGWGLGWYGSLTRTQLLWPMLGAWAAMLLWSGPWLSRYHFGPLEWLWRCLTYGRRFSFRRD